MAQDREEPVPDEIHRRLVPRDVEEQARRQKLPLVQTVARFLCLHQSAQEVGPGALAALVREGAEVSRDRLRRLAPPLDHLGGDGQRDRVERPRHVAGPLLDLLRVARGHAQELGDHRHRQRVGQRLDHVDPLLIGHAVEQAFHDGLDVPAEGLHHARREGLADERPEPRVVGRIAKHHP